MSEGFHAGLVDTIRGAIGQWYDEPIPDNPFELRRLSWNTWAAWRDLRRISRTIDKRIPRTVETAAATLRQMQRDNVDALHVALETGAVSVDWSKLREVADTLGINIGEEDGGDG